MIFRDDFKRIGTFLEMLLLYSISSRGTFMIFYIFIFYKTYRTFCYASRNLSVHTNRAPMAPMKVIPESLAAWSQSRNEVSRASPHRVLITTIAQRLLKCVLLDRT